MMPNRAYFALVSILLAALASFTTRSSDNPATPLKANNNTKAFASLEGPVSEGWTPAERWKDQVIEEKRVVRLAAGTAYTQLKVTGEIPAEGNVVMRIRYYSAGKPFDVGVGSWGAPTLRSATRPKGWFTESLLFDAGRVGRMVKDGRIPLILRNGGDDGAAIERIEMMKPDPAETMELFRQWVKDGTDTAWATSKGGQYQEVKNPEAVIPAEPSKDDEARGAIPFVRTYLSSVYPSSVPKKEERVTTGKIVLPPGRYGQFQFAVHALKDIEKLTAEVTGSAVKGLNAEIRWVECVPLHAVSSRSKKFTVSPQRLWPREIFPTCSVKSGESRAWWLTVKAADDLAAGDYAISLAVNNDGKLLAKFEVSVTVLRFKLPVVTDKCFMIVDRGMVEEESILKDMADHGVNALGAFNDFQPVKSGGVDFAEWDGYFANLKKLGLNTGFFWYLGNPDSGNAVKEDVGADNFLKILKGLDERVKDGRYPKLFAMSIDEAVRNGKAFKQSCELFQQLREQKMDLKILGCSLDNFNATKRYEGNADLIACNGSFEENGVWCREKNMLLNMYAFVCSSMTAGATRLNYGFHPWRYGSKVMNGWALRWNNDHPYNDLDSAADWEILLPNWTGRPIASPSWEGFREGVDDQRYLAFLEDLTKQGKSDGKLLEEIRKTGIGKTDQMVEKIVGDSVFGASMKNAGDLEIARARVIQEILKALGQK